MIYLVRIRRALVPPRDGRAVSACRSLLIPQRRWEGDHAGGMMQRSVGQGPGERVDVLYLPVNFAPQVAEPPPRSPPAAAAQHSVVKNNANTMEAKTPPPHRRPVYSLKPLNFFQKTFMTQPRAVQHKARDNNGRNNRRTIANKPGWIPRARHRSAARFGSSVPRTCA